MTFGRQFFTVSSVLALLALAACSSSLERDPRDTNGPALKNYADKSAACRDFIDALPVDYFYDFITVPENPQDPRGPQVDVFYYGKKNVAGTPVLFLNGGPAFDSHNSFQLMTDRSRAVAAWADAPLIFMDQRGTGCSSNYPQGDSEKITARLRFYGSSYIVGDAEKIRRTLFGDQPWKIFGEDYGAWIVHRYAVLAPKSLVSATAHGDAIFSSARNWAAGRISAQNRILEGYFSQYPEDRARLKALHDYLTPRTCFPNPEARPRRCGYAVIDSLATYLAFTPRWPWVHDWLQAIVQDNKVLGLRLTDYLRKNIFSQSVDPNNLTYWPRQVIDYYDRGVVEFDRPTCTQVYLDLHARGELPEYFLLHDCMTAMQFAAATDQSSRYSRLQKLVHDYGVDTLSTDSLKHAIGQNPALKFFLYSGALDSLMPPELFQPEVQSLGAAITFRELWASGHDGYYTDLQVATDTLN